MIFESKLLTADPKEHLRRVKILLSLNDDSFLLYAALELRLAIERIVHNELSLSEDASLNNRRDDDAKKKKLIMNRIDPESDCDCKIFFKGESGEWIFWDVYKNIPEGKVKSIEGRLGGLLHMQRQNFGMKDDPWYKKTRSFLTDTVDYFQERITDSQPYFSFAGVENFRLEKI